MGAREILNTLGALVGTTLALVLVAGATARPHAERLAAVFPPWWDVAHVFEAAASAGARLAAGHLPGTVIVQGEAATLADRLHAAGALLIMDPSLAAGCRTRPDVSA